MPLNPPNPRDGLLEGENPDLRQEICEFLQNGESWLHTPNDQLGGRTPEEMIATGKEYVVRDIIRAARFGGMA